MKSIIVTGGAGFIGSHLVEELVKRNFKVIVIDDLSTGKINNLKKVKKKIIFKKADISNYGKIKKLFNKKIDCVFHLAGRAEIVPSINNPQEYFKCNILGSFNISELCRINEIKKIIYTASSTCYGLAKKVPTDEMAKVDTRYPYALTKKVGEDIIMHYGKLYKISTISLRLFNVYGPRSRTTSSYGAMFGVFLAQKLKNMPLTIVGNGYQKRDFTFVTDVVLAMMKVLLTRKYINDIFNVGSGKTVSVISIAKKLSDKFVFIPKRPGEPDITFASIKKIKKVFKWSPKIDIDLGIKILLKNLSYWNKSKIWTPKEIKIATKDWFKYLK
jgi:UDP-glucose 4-epimerase